MIWLELRNLLAAGLIHLAVLAVPRSNRTARLLLADASEAL